MGQFSVDLTRIVAKAKGNMDVVARKIVFEAFNKVVLKSPVDTGAFRNSWTVGFGALPVAMARVPTQSGIDAHADVARVLTTEIVGVNAWLVNPMPYGVKLEYGWSKQAPAGMVRLTLAEISSHYGR
ncbi:hypothetical protein [Chromobacterium haemolyticum]|uniref:hypothetical protein n=1 Tax=Chromobacterium TaxID=535 RepID=UPI0040575D4B